MYWHGKKSSLYGQNGAKNNIGVHPPRKGLEPHCDMINLMTKKQPRRRMQIVLAQAEGFENSALWQMVLGKLWRNVGDWKFHNLCTVQSTDFPRFWRLPSSPIQGFFEKLQTITYSKSDHSADVHKRHVGEPGHRRAVAHVVLARVEVSSRKRSSRWVPTISHQVFTIGSSFSCWLFPMFSSLPMTRCQDHRVPFQYNLHCTKIEGRSGKENSGLATYQNCKTIWLKHGQLRYLQVESNPLFSFKGIHCGVFTQRLEVCRSAKKYRHGAEPQTVFFRGLARLQPHREKRDGWRDTRRETQNTHEEETWDGLKPNPGKCAQTTTKPPQNQQHMKRDMKRHSLFLSKRENPYK